MPPGYVKTIREEILCVYRKLICRSDLDAGINCGFVSSRFKALKAGEITMSGMIREWQWEQELPKGLRILRRGRGSANRSSDSPKSRRGRFR